MSGRVLMVAFHFPPSGAVAAHRASKFARYLPEFGWEPAVVARRPDPRQPLDASFAGRPAPHVTLRPFEPGRALGLLPASWAAALRARFLIPDEETGWKRKLRRVLPRLLEDSRSDLLWANSVPPGSLVAAADAARRTGVPLVVDFHNEWTRNPYYRPPTPGVDAEHRRLEEEVVRAARAVVTLNPLHTEDLRRRFPGARVETLENGFDPEDLAAAPGPAAPGTRLVFTYAGAVYGHQGPEPFLRALARLQRSDVEVRVVGDRFGAFRPGAWPFPVTVLGHRPRAGLERVFSESSAFFLCLETPAARQLPAKLYEYLGAGRPTFAIAPRGGAVEDWFSRTGAGTCVATEEPEKWAEALAGFIRTLPAYRPPDGRAFHRRALAGRLARIFDEVRSPGGAA